MAMRAKTRHSGFHFTSGRLCLDFANTRSWRPSARPMERLHEYADLLAWARQAGTVSRAETRRLAAGAARARRLGARVFARAIALREAIYRVFSARAHGQAPAPRDLATLETELAGALAQLRLVQLGGRFTLASDPGSSALERVLWPIARSAADVLTVDDSATIKTCAGKECRWLFLDTTRNRRRRWCDMRVCGNRAKVRRYYARNATSR
jgi:predicted RNA-binding Zn ribbon-like protein